MALCKKLLHIEIVHRKVASSTTNNSEEEVNYQLWLRNKLQGAELRGTNFLFLTHLRCYIDGTHNNVLTQRMSGFNLYGIIFPH